MSNQEIIRRGKFCQIVKEICGSNEYLVVGIDVAKDKHHAFMGTATGKSFFRKLIFENNIEGFSRLLKKERGQVYYCPLSILSIMLSICFLSFLSYFLRLETLRIMLLTVLYALILNSSPMLLRFSPRM